MEKAIFGLLQRRNENNEFFVPHHGFFFEDLVTQRISLKEICA